MTDEKNDMTEWETSPASQEEGAGAALLGYVLLLASTVFLVTGIIAVVIAYIYRDEAPEWLKSHYQLQIRTFWISFLYVTAGMLLMVVFVGYIIILFWLVWFLVRCIKGIRYVNMRRAYPNPESWWM